MLEIVVALIAGGCSVLGVVITSIFSYRRSETQIQTAQAVTNTKIDELTRVVREHNNFARRVPVLEEQMKVASHRIADLERDAERRNA